MKEQTDRMMELSNPEHESSLVDTLGLYLAREEYLDLTFLCKDARKVRAHKLVFTSVSPFMKELISNWDGPQDDVIISMAEVSYKTMKLITSFLYDGMMKLGKEELIEFRDVLNMLDIVMPDAVMSPVLSFSAAYPLPPVRRLDKSQRINLDKAHKAREVFNPQIIDTRTLCSKVFNQNVEEELPATTNGDDDPLDVPDFYFVPQQSASTSNQADNVLAKEPTTSAAVLNQPREQAAAMDKSIASRHTRQMVKKGNRQAIPKPKEKGVPNKVVTKSTPLQEQLKIQNQAYLYAPFDVEGLTGLPPLQPTTNDNCMQNSEVPPAAAETLESGSKKRKDTSTAKRSHKKKRKQDLLKTGIQRTF